ncbi:MAG TPA: hypothetical protein PLJ11_05075 [Methanomassiliicoccales archaeon]|nr:hypothetical protein [Methanomassiliicoccales archaeon]
MELEFSPMKYLRQMIADGREIIGEKDGHEVAVALIDGPRDGYIEVYTAPAGGTLYIPVYVIDEDLQSKDSVETAIWDEVIDAIYRSATPEDWAEWEEE